MKCVDIKNDDTMDQVSHLYNAVPKNLSSKGASPQHKRPEVCMSNGIDYLDWLASQQKGGKWMQTVGIADNPFTFCNSRFR